MNMRKTISARFSVAALAVGAVLGLSSVAQATTSTFVSGPSSVDFNDVTFVFSNFTANGLLGSGSTMTLSGVGSLTPSVIGPNLGIWSVSGGTFSVGLVESAGTTTLTVAGTEVPLGSVGVVNNYNVTGTWIQTAGGTEFANFTTVVPSAAPSAVGSYSLVFNSQGGGEFLINTVITPPQTHNTGAIPEPVTAIFGLSGLAVLGLRLTGRRSR